MAWFDLEYRHAGRNVKTFNQDALTYFRGKSVMYSRFASTYGGG